MDRRHFIHGLAVSLPFMAGCISLIKDDTNTSTATPPTTPTKTAAQTTDKPSPTVTSTVQPLSTATQAETQTATQTAIQTATQATGTTTETPITINPSQLQTYTNPRYGYSVNYPAEWTVNTDDLTYVEIEPSQASKIAQMGISTYELERSEMTVDFLVSEFTQHMKQQFDKYQIIGKRSVTLPGGYAATVLDAVISDSNFGGFIAHVKYCFAIGNRRKYMTQFLISKSNYTAVEEALDTIVTSLTIT